MIAIFIIATIVTQTIYSGRIDHELAKQGIISPRLAAKYGGEARARRKVEKYGLFDFLADAWRSHWSRRGDALTAAREAPSSRPGRRPSGRDRRRAARGVIDAVGAAVAKAGRVLVEPVGRTDTPREADDEPTGVICASCGQPVDRDAPGMLCPACRARRKEAVEELVAETEAESDADVAEPERPTAPTPAPTGATAKAGDLGIDPAYIAEWKRYKDNVAAVTAAPTPEARAAVLDLIERIDGPQAAQDALRVVLREEARKGDLPQAAPPQEAEATESTNVAQEAGTGMGAATGEATGVIGAAEQARLIGADINETVIVGRSRYAGLEKCVETLAGCAGLMGLTNQAFVVQALSLVREELAAIQASLQGVAEANGPAIEQIATDYGKYMPSVTARADTGEVANDSALTGN